MEIAGDIMKERVVIYHANCLDGFTSAWAAYRCFGEEGTEYVPASYGDEPPNVSGRHVFVVDFSYARDVLIVMQRQAASLVVLDHHKTAAEAEDQLLREGHRVHACHGCCFRREEQVSMPDASWTPRTMPEQPMLT